MGDLTRVSVGTVLVRQLHPILNEAADRFLSDLGTTPTSQKDKLLITPSGHVEIVIQQKAQRRYIQERILQQ